MKDEASAPATGVHTPRQVLPDHRIHALSPVAVDPNNLASLLGRGLHGNEVHELADWAVW